MPVNGTSIDQMNTALYQGIDNNMKLDKQRTRKLPSRVSDALMPSMNKPLRRGGGDYQRRFDIAVENVPARTFFMGLVKGSDYNMAVSPEVKGNITLSLKHVTVEQVLQTLEEVYGYAYRRTSTGYYILANKIKTKMFSVNYLELQRKGRSIMRINSGQVSQNNQQTNQTSTQGVSTNSYSNNTSSLIGDVESRSDIDFWKQLKLTLKNMISEEGGRSVTVNPLAGVVVVRAYPSELKQVEYYLDAVQNNMDRQVILEAKILEVQLKDKYQMGIDWRIFGARLNALSDFRDVDITNRTFPDAFNIAVKWNPADFTTTIRALTEQGNVQVLSSPRIATLNNQKAVIKVGTDEFYVTNISSSTTTAANTVTPTEDVELTPFFSGISLDVTPQIDASGHITLHVHPTVSKVVDQRKDIDLGRNRNLVLPLAKSTVRESDTIVHAIDKQVIVIGGLMENGTSEELAGLPFFGNVPFLGTLFKNTKQTSIKSELVILIKPTIVKRNVWTKKLAESQQNVIGLKRGFHIGGRPDIFGTEGEKPWKLGPQNGGYAKPKEWSK